MDSQQIRGKFRHWMISGAVAIGALGFLLGSTAGADDAPCKATTFSVAKVEKACKAGGRKAAKVVMKGVVKKAKAAGESMNCKTCHDDLKSFSLTSNAVADLKKWM